VKIRNEIESAILQYNIVNICHVPLSSISAISHCSYALFRLEINFEAMFPWMKNVTQGNTTQKYSCLLISARSLLFFFSLFSSLSPHFLLYFSLPSAPLFVIPLPFFSSLFFQSPSSSVYLFIFFLASSIPRHTSHLPSPSSAL
jgi:hypothetical protein